MFWLRNKKIYLRIVLKSSSREATLPFSILSLFLWGQILVRKNLTLWNQILSFKSIPSFLKGNNIQGSKQEVTDVVFLSKKMEEIQGVLPPITYNLNITLNIKK